MISALLVWVSLAGPAWADCTVLSGGLVHRNGEIARGETVVSVDRRIDAVGKGLDGLQLVMGADTQVRSATWKGEPCTFVQVGNKHVTAGLIEVNSQLGLVEVGLEPGTRNQDGGGDRVRAALRVVDAYDPLSTLIAVQRLGGLTGAVANPAGGTVSGHAGFVSLAGATQAEAVVDRETAMVAHISGSSVAAGVAFLRELLDDAAVYRKSKAAFEQNRMRAFADGAGRLDLEALAPVLDGELPLVVTANRSADIEALLRFQADTGVSLVINGGAEAWIHADALAEAAIPVIVDPLVYGPGGFDQIRGRADNGKLLHEAGVAVIISTWSSHNARTLRQSAGNAVRGGMDPEAALAAITATPARVFGQPDRGQIAVGSVADIAIWSGDPLELSSQVERLLIGGEDIELVSRQTRLRDAYRTLPGTPVGPLSLPE